MNEVTDQPSIRALDRIGLQLYTVRNLMQQDVASTLERVAAIGYQEVEFAGYFGHSAAEIKSLVDRVGLDAVSGHIPLQVLRDNLDPAIEAAQVIGHRYIVLAWIPQDERTSIDAYKRLAEEFNGFGASCRAAGLQFAYHNHDFEFEPIQGHIPYDVLLEVCDPERVQLEIDLFWITKGGRDPRRYFDQHPGRFPLCHVKDMDAQGNMVDVGQGVIDFSDIFAHAEQAGLNHFLVEHDRPADPLASIAGSYWYLSQMTG